MNKLVFQYRINRSKRQLQKSINEIVVIMEAHKSAGLPAGHEYYNILWGRASKRIQDYQHQYKLLVQAEPSFEEIAAGIPPLRELQSLAEGKPSSTVLMVTLGLVIGGAIFTFLLAVYHDLYIFMIHK